MAFSRDDIFNILATVRDPEIPVLSVVDLGVVRDVEVRDDEVTVKITPTYSGCPAMDVIQRDILSALRDKGVPKASVTTVYAPAWTTDWMSDEAKQKLKAYGIAPPGQRETEVLVPLGKKSPPVPCPFCESRHTRLQSQFGSTACKSLHFCDDCKQPFEHFKAF